MSLREQGKDATHLYPNADAVESFGVSGGERDVDSARYIVDELEARSGSGEEPAHPGSMVMT